MASFQKTINGTQLQKQNFKKMILNSVGKQPFKVYDRGTSKNVYGHSWSIFMVIFKQVFVCWKDILLNIFKLLKRKLPEFYLYSRKRFDKKNSKKIVLSLHRYFWFLKEHYFHPLSLERSCWTCQHKKCSHHDAL